MWHYNHRTIKVIEARLGSCLQSTWKSIFKNLRAKSPSKQFFFSFFGSIETSREKGRQFATLASNPFWNRGKDQTNEVIFS